MKHIQILIVDDDFTKIEAIIKAIREAFSGELSITQAETVQEAIENIQKKEFHLLITDFQMPLRPGEQPDNNGGIALIKSLYKKKTKAILPLYIVGLTQFLDLQEIYNGVWKVWYYDAAEDKWRNNLRDLIHHISLIRGRVLEEKIETLFVEGTTDKNVLTKVLDLYYAPLKDHLTIETITFGAGASWVERQLFIWAKSLVRKNGTAAYLLAAGLFDNDEPGNSAINQIRKQIPLDSAESNTFVVVKTAFKHSILLKSIKAKGISFPTTLEDLSDPTLFAEAKKQGLLVKRNVHHYKVDSKFLALSAEDLTADRLKEAGFSEEEIILVLYKVDDQFKVEYNKLLLGSSKAQLLSISFLLKEILEKLKLI
jgi:CheY-like chemotaxis protein